MKGNLSQAIVNGINDLKTLEIKTIVGNFTWDDTTKKITYDAGQAKVIISQIDLLQGDVTTAFSPDFLQPPYDEVRKYHAEREKQGHDIIKANIAALQELVSLLLKLPD